MLAVLKAVPDGPAELDRWAFHNRAQIDLIRAGIQAQKGVNLTQYQLYPLDLDNPGTWLENNQQAHNDFNAALGTQGADLTEVNFDNANEREAWVWLEHQEHSIAETALGIAS